MENAKQTCIQMLTQRGYEEILTNDENNITARKKNDNIIVFFDDQPKLNKGLISKYMSIMKDENISHSIIIYNDSVTNMTNKSVEQSLEMNIELFCVDELQFNITQHRLQPKKFRILSKEENNKFRKTFTSKIPIMKYLDPIRRFYNFNAGDIIEITDRRDIVSYRIVK